MRLTQQQKAKVLTQLLNRFPELEQDEDVDCSDVVSDLMTLIRDAERGNK